jgi:uncharacterized protein YukE
MAKYMSRAKRLAEALGMIDTVVQGLNSMADDVRDGREINPGRIEDFVNIISDSTSSVEELKEELENWYDNLPENFQNGMKGDELQEAIDALDGIYSSLDEQKDAVEDLLTFEASDPDDKKEELAGAMEDIANELESAQMEDVTFPGMY